VSFGDVCPYRYMLLRVQPFSTVFSIPLLCLYTGFVLSFTPLSGTIFLTSWEVPFVGTQCFFWESCGSGGGSARPFLAGVDLGRWMVGLLVLRTGSEDGVRGIGVEVDLDLDVVAVGGV
jgi:hypothetical protein